ncbi:MAG: hypothetical protein AAF809_15395, partial [Bacteroidota bacterium]
MGQQQLLLIILGVVIVGLAVANGILAFDENKRKQDMDRVAYKAVEIAGDIIAWKKKPGALGGGAELNDLGAELDLARLGYVTNGTAICSYAQGVSHTKGDNCLITEYGEFHIARGGGRNWMHPDAIGYVHAISRYNKHTYRVQIIADEGRLFTNLDDFTNG